MTPKWVFSIATDKSLYNLGEEVKITMTLENLGFLTHTFDSFYSDPFVVTIAQERETYLFSEV